MFIWDFVADKILGQIVDWFYSQVVGFLGNFFSEMGSMGAELFEMNWVQSVVLFFSYLGWALFATGLVVAVFECGIEYSAGRGNVKETALNVLKGFLAVSLFTQVPVRLYSLAISLQGTLTAGITGFGSTSIGDAAKAALADLENLKSLTESTYPLRGFGRETSGLTNFSGTVDLISYDDFDLQCLKKDSALKRGSDLSKVFGDSNFVLATSDQDSTWKIGDTVQIGDETLNAR